MQAVWKPTRYRRPVAYLGSVALVIALSAGCSGALPESSASGDIQGPERVTATTTDPEAIKPDQAPESSTGGQSPATATAPSPQPSDEPGDEPGDPPEATAAPAVPDEAQPSLQAQPEPALPGEEIRETYGDNPSPADSVEGTLCNLTQEHLSQLSEATRSEGAPDEQMLRLSALSLSDDLSVWEGIAWQYPDLEGDIEVARQIYAHWEYAIGLLDVGDDGAAVAELTAADQLIAGLPSNEAIEVGC